MPPASVQVTDLRCEYAASPLGLGVRQPRLSWRLASERRGEIQAAYQILVANDPRTLAQHTGNLWDTGRVESDQSIHHPYAGAPLQSRQRCCWKVRVWDGHGQASDWSQLAAWEMGLLEPADWQATWITPDLDEDLSTSPPCPLLRTTFDIAGTVRAARVYATSLGLYDMALNGQPVSDALFRPGWTSYSKRLQFQTYDVTSLLLEGGNAIGVTLADGWYRGYLGFSSRRMVYGEKLALLAQLVIEYEDGRVQVVVTNDGWKAATGPILKSDIYNGETVDARLERPGWDAPGYDDSAWAGVRPFERGLDGLTAQAGPDVRRMETLRPAAILRTPAGDTVVDMGQNMVGWLRLRARGEAGQVITLRHAEVLDQHGELYLANLRGIEQADRFILKGGGDETLEPRFTFHGFRYAAIDGFPGDLSLDDVSGVVIYSDLPQTGRFECSNPLINQLQSNIVWGQKGNFLEVPTDCPQRDERLGWTGDAQAFMSTAAFNMDVAGFMTRWLRDLAADQTDDGRVPHVVPDILGGYASAGWADAAVICPWTLYECYGDLRILEEQYPSMAGWVRYVRGQLSENGVWDNGWHFGDWLAVRGPDLNFPNPVTDRDLIATAFYAHSTSLLQQTALALGKAGEAEAYGQWLAQVRDAFCREYVTPNGRLAPNTQTAYVLALHFDLLPPEQRAQAARRLDADVRQRGNHLTTGFLGATYLCHVLSRFGYLDTAYALMEQQDYPSWLYPVTRGATTIWERWDGIRPDGTFQDPGMNSFNHYAYGSIGAWLYRVAAGLDLDPGGPGYKRIVIHPRPGGSLTHARASLDSPHGRILSGWALSDGEFQLDVTLPPNTRGVVRLPAQSAEAVTESGQLLAQAEGITRIAAEEGGLAVYLGAGRYSFHVPAQVRTL